MNVHVPGQDDQVGTKLMALTHAKARTMIDELCLVWVYHRCFSGVRCYRWMVYI